MAVAVAVVLITTLVEQAALAVAVMVERMVMLELLELLTQAAVVEAVELTLALVALAVQVLLFCLGQVALPLPMTQ
jgi:hypothetical protein